MGNQVRVRFAPSPTGYLHVGGLRTALYNYLFARHNGGKFILRIEDTDQTRKVEGAVENLINTLRWIGIDYDEGPDRDGSYGPYIQSQRLELYKKYAEDLVKNDHAYYCFCSSERLQQLRAQQRAYDRHCRSISKEEAQTRAEKGEKHVIRMKVPTDGEITFEDVIRGRVTISFQMVDDQVLLKSDGFPTYHLAVVVDDHFMDISHIIRGEEWLSSVPKHLLLYQYFGWNVPVMAHLPLLLNPDKSKLSKRQGDVAVEEYRQKGYLKEAIINFIALLGWNPGDDREIFFMEDLIKEFTLERVGKSGAVFNIEKLNWLNLQHIKLKSNEELAELVEPYLHAKGYTNFRKDYLVKVIELMKERMTVLPDLVENGDYFFRDPVSYDQTGVKKYLNSDAKELLAKLLTRIQSLKDFTHTSIEKTLRELADELQIKASKLIHPARLAITGKTGGPGLFELMEILGKETVVRRLTVAIEKQWNA